MYPTTTTYTEAIHAPGRDIRAMATLGNTTINSEDIIKLDYSILVTDSNDFSIGDTPSASVEIVLNNISGKFDEVTLNSEIEVSIGVVSSGSIEYVTLGKFIIDYASRPDLSITIKGMDRMIKLDKQYVSSITYPTTLKNIVIDACSQCNIELELQADFINHGMTINDKYDLTSKTCREVVGYAATASAGFAYVNRLGKLVIDNFANKQSVETLTSNNYYTLKKSETDFIAINKLIVRNGEDELTYGDGTNAFIISDNPFLEGASQAVLSNIYNVLSNIDYQGYICEWQGNPAVDPGDIIQFVDKKGITYNGIIAEQKFTFDGGLRAINAAYADSTTNRETSAKGALERRVDALEKRPAGDVNIEVIEEITTTTEVSHINNCWTKNLNVEYLETNFSALDTRQPYQQYRNYIRIFDNIIEFHVAEMSRFESEYLKTIDNEDVYWTAINQHQQAYKYFTLTSPLERYPDMTDEEVNAFKVQIRKTIRDDIKKKEIIASLDGIYTPVEILGIGNGIQANQEYQFLDNVNLMQNQAVILKDKLGYLIEYYKSNGSKAWLRLGDNGIEMSHGSLKSIDFYNDGFKVNGNCKFKWTSNGLLKDDGELIHITESNQNIVMEDED